VKRNGVYNSLGGALLVIGLIIVFMVQWQDHKGAFEADLLKMKPVDYFNITGAENDAADDRKSPSVQTKETTMELKENKEMARDTPKEEVGQLKLSIPVPHVEDLNTAQLKEKVGQLKQRLQIRVRRGKNEDAVYPPQ
jgi:hypothetical protein